MYNVYLHVKDHYCSVWMFALGTLALYWVKCPIPRILILRLNVNIFVWMFRYSGPMFDIEVECQMLFGGQSVALQLY
jgi:hypothetical protein